MIPLLLMQHQVDIRANTNPLIAFVNPKSGSNDGVKVMRMLKRILNPVQVSLCTLTQNCANEYMKVFDLSRGGPREGYVLFSVLFQCNC